MHLSLYSLFIPSTPENFVCHIFPTYTLAFPPLFVYNVPSVRTFFSCSHVHIHPSSTIFNEIFPASSMPEKYRPNSFNALYSMCKLLHDPPKDHACLIPFLFQTPQQEAEAKIAISSLICHAVSSVRLSLLRCFYLLFRDGSSPSPRPARESITFFGFHGTFI